jgi:hypothetical protein
VNFRFVFEDEDEVRRMVGGRGPRLIYCAPAIRLCTVSQVPNGVVCRSDDGARGLIRDVRLGPLCDPMEGFAANLNYPKGIGVRSKF